MDNKGELTTQQIVIIIILVASFAVILFFILKLNLGGENAQNICHNSVVERGTSIVPSSAFPLDCKRQYVCLSANGNCAPMTKPIIIKVGNKTAVYQALAGQMANCWWMFGEGKINYVGSGITKNLYCSLCSQIAFDPSVYKVFGGNTNFSMKDFYQYLSTAKMSSGQTYADYMGLTGITSYSGNLGTVDMTKEYYSLMGITNKISTLGWIGVGAAAAGVVATALVLSPVTGGLSLGSLLGVLTVAGSATAGGVLGGVFVAPVVEGASGNQYIPPSLIQVNSAQFTALNCSEITTAS